MVREGLATNTVQCGQRQQKRSGVAHQCEPGGLFPVGKERKGLILNEIGHEGRSIRS